MRAVLMQFNKVSLADQIKPVASQRQRAFHSHAGLDPVARRVDQMVCRLPARSVDIVEMNQPALARAISPVLEHGKGNRVCFGHDASATIPTGRYFWSASWQRY